MNEAILWGDYTVHSFPISESVSLLYNEESKEWLLRREEDISTQEDDEIVIEDTEVRFPENGMTACGISLSFADFSAIKTELYNSLGIIERG